MMTPDAFVALAAGLAMVKAKTVLGTVRLVVGGKTFATVGWPQAGWAVVKLAPAEQRGIVAEIAGLSPEPGGRGRKGVTLVDLAQIDETDARRVLIAAWRHAQAPGRPFAQAG